jgi:hypothetical protein
MSAFNTLKLSALQKPLNVPPIQQRRNKLAKRLWEQMELAKALIAGTQYTAKKFRSYTDAESGLRKQVEVNKIVKAWWFTAENGKLVLRIKYGSKILELGKGKYAVEVATNNELLPTLEVIKAAVLNGELDSAIDSAANKLREGFGK